MPGGVPGGTGNVPGLPWGSPEGEGMGTGPNPVIDFDYSNTQKFYNLRNLGIDPNKGSKQAKQAINTHQQFHNNIRNVFAESMNNYRGDPYGTQVATLAFTEGAVGMVAAGVGLQGAGAAALGAGPQAGAIPAVILIILGTECIFVGVDAFIGMTMGPSY